MVKNIRLSRVSIRGLNHQIEYATVEALMESINALKGTSNAPIDQYIRDLLQGKVDSVSFTKDRPYYYFHARRFDDSLSFTVKDSDRIIDFSLPLNDAEKLLLA